MAVSSTLARSQFDLSTQEFRDGLDCRFGGLVTWRHNEVHNAFGDRATLVWIPVLKKQIVSDGSADMLINDLNCVFVVCGSLRMRHCLILEGLTLMSCFIVLTLPVMFYILLNVTRNSNIGRLIRINMLPSLFFVSPWME